MSEVDEAGRRRLEPDRAAAPLTPPPLPSRLARRRVTMRAMGSQAARLDLVVVVPVRSLEGAKTRLGEALDAEERLELTARLLARLLETVRAWGRAGATVVVSPDPAVLELVAGLGARPLRQRTAGLNEALEEARADPVVSGAATLLVLPADLPAITPAALQRVVEAAGHTARGRRAAVVVTDQRGGGTNALLLRPPDLVRFAFGPGSHRAHLEAARAAGAEAVPLVDPELSFDLDTPDDLLAWGAAAGRAAERDEPGAVPGATTDEPGAR